jgi:hypothetical protein
MLNYRRYKRKSVFYVLFSCMLTQSALLHLQEKALPRSKYEEDVYINNHTSVWGSWWKDHQWGYKCCKQMIRNSYCTGAAGIEAAEAATDLMKANIARKEATEGVYKIWSFFCLFLCNILFEIKVNCVGFQLFLLLLKRPWYILI